MATANDARRRWAGTTLDDRRALRRNQLLDAALELLRAGSNAVSVRAVCRQAQLTERYFYESFTDRDELLLALYEDVAGQTRLALLRAVAHSPGEPVELARAAVTAFVELMLDDPRKGTLLLLAPLTDPALTRRGSELLPTFTRLIHDQLPAALDESERQMIAIGLIGALTNLFVNYLAGTLTVTRDQLVEHCVQLLLGPTTR